MSKVANSLRDGLLQFYRNGRWGTCGDCPRDTDNKAYPEFCKNTKRYDHNLNIVLLLSSQIKVQSERPINSQAESTDMVK